MKNHSVSFYKKYLLLFIFIFVLPFRFYHFNYPILDAFNFRQAQTATFTLNFYKNGINLFQTELDIFGMGKERFLTLEFPLYEAVVALLYRLFFVSDMWGRTVSIVSGMLGAWYLYKLVKLILKDEFTAVFSSFFFLFAPLNMFYQRSFMIEPFIIMLLLAGMYYFCCYVNDNKTRSYILSISFLSLGFIHKGLYGPFWLLPMVVYYLHKNSIRKLFNIKTAMIFIIPLIILILWQIHVNNINTLSGNEFFTTGNTAHQEWNFGFLKDRLNIADWQFRLKQVANGIFLKPAIVLFFIGIWSIRKKDKSNFLIFFLLSQIIYFLILFRIQQQNYYQMVMVSVFSVIISIGFTSFTDWINLLLKAVKLDYRMQKIFTAGFIFIFCTLYMYKSWINALPSFFVDWDWHQRLKTVASVIVDDSYSILITPEVDWNSVYTYIPQRKMKQTLLNSLSQYNIELWKKEGYSYIILHEYEKYPQYLSRDKSGYSLDFLSNQKNILTIKEFKIYDLKQN